MDFHHVGIATDDVEALAARYGELFGLSVAHEETLEQLRVVFLPLGDGYFELLEPLESSGPIADHLDAATALHHLAVTVPDVQAAVDRAADAGVRPIDEAPRPGAWGHEVAFLHPADTGGVLLEFVGE